METELREGETRRSWFTRRGGKANYLFAAGVVAIVGVASTWTILTALWPPAPAVCLLHFECTQCGHQFVMDGQDRPAHRIDEPWYPDCPKCKEPNTGRMMIVCPACEKYYVWSRSMKRGTRDICPHCGADFLKALEERIKREQKK